MGLISSVKGIINSLFKRDPPSQDAFGVNIVSSGKMDAHLDLWYKMYRGKRIGIRVYLNKR